MSIECWAGDKQLPELLVVTINYRVDPHAWLYAGWVRPASPREEPE